MSTRKQRLLFVLLGLAVAVSACVTHRGGRLSQHRWWSRLGPVLPHETFPADCRLCHEGESWHILVPDFRFDHGPETGYELVGAHAQAQCLRCHNDRGPVEQFVAQGCAGCHEDVHTATLGADCESCHGQDTWFPVGQLQRHARTRFPLVGAHTEVSCRRCHVGAEVGRFLPTDTACVTCHRDDLARATNPNHVNLGLVKRCDRCHRPTVWTGALLN